MHWMLKLSLYHLLFTLCGIIQWFSSFSSFLNIYFLATFLSLTNYNSFSSLAYWPSANTFSHSVSTCHRFPFLVPSHWKLPNATTILFYAITIFFFSCIRAISQSFFVTTLSPLFLFCLYSFPRKSYLPNFLSLLPWSFHSQVPFKGLSIILIYAIILSLIQNNLKCHMWMLFESNLEWQMFVSSNIHCDGSKELWKENSPLLCALQVDPSYSPVINPETSSPTAIITVPLGPCEKSPSFSPTLRCCTSGPVGWDVPCLPSSPCAPTGSSGLPGKGNWPLLLPACTASAKQAAAFLPAAHP